MTSIRVDLPPNRARNTQLPETFEEVEGLEFVQMNGAGIQDDACRFIPGHAIPTARH